MPWKCVGLVLNIDSVRCVFFNWVTFNFVNCGKQKQNLVHVNPSPDNKLFIWSNLRITDWLPKLVFQQLKTFVLINYFLWSLMTYLQGKRNLLNWFILKACQITAGMTWAKYIFYLNKYQKGLTKYLLRCIMQ